MKLGPCTVIANVNLGKPQAVMAAFGVGQVCKERHAKKQRPILAATVILTLFGVFD